MRQADAARAVWAAYPRRSPEKWELVLVPHHTSSPGRPVWRWELTGHSARQDRYEQGGFVDANGVEVDA